MAAVSDQVADILDGTDSIDFDMGNLKVRNHQYGIIASAIRDCRIGVVSYDGLEDGTDAAYSATENVIYYRPGVEDELWDPWMRSKFVHEATHALNDYYQRSWLSRIDNEASGFITQMVYLLNNVGAIPGNYRKDPLYRDICDAAIELAYAITGKPAITDFSLSYRDSLPVQDDATYLATGAVWPVDIGGNPALATLRKKLSSKGAYDRDVGVNSIDCLGLPVRGKIKSVEVNRKKLSLSIGKKLFNFDWDGSTTFESRTGNTLPLGPKDPLMIPGGQAIVVCETVSRPQYATIIKVLGA